MKMFPTMCTGLERHAEAFAEHTQAGIDRILNGSSKRAAATGLECNRAAPEGSSPCPAPVLQEPAFPSPVACRARYYDAASRILEEEGQLFSHDNANELGALIQQWIEDARDNWEPR